ncbi:MAG TPA: hypothetical protein VEA69_10805 [Tepidisphaeraceae bacterium]|nr:hypothetical protein [Tepidisphaeraceae bacterium]
MATLITQSSETVTRERETSSMTPQTALKYAWGAWFILMAIPAVAFLAVIWQFADRTPAVSIDDGWKWFIGVLATMIVTIPASIFLRSRLFRGYYDGECVAPKTYLTGMLVTWITAVGGGMLALYACLQTGTMLPNLFAGAVAFIFFVTQWPSGMAMVCDRQGATDDPERYEEPR